MRLEQLHPTTLEHSSVCLIEFLSIWGYSPGHGDPGRSATPFPPAWPGAPVPGAARSSRFASEEAHRVGSLLGASQTTDVIDAHVATLALDHGAMVITSDDEDFERLAACLPKPIHIEHI